MYPVPESVVCHAVELLAALATTLAALFGWLTAARS